MNLRTIKGIKMTNESMQAWDKFTTFSISLDFLLSSLWVCTICPKGNVSLEPFKYISKDIRMECHMYTDLRRHPETGYTTWLNEVSSFFFFFWCFFQQELWVARSRYLKLEYGFKVYIYYHWCQFYIHSWSKKNDNF
jgi:hypothetical protein